MADIAFSDKAGSSNFTAGGDKRNQIFADLLLNRAELETYLTSLRRQQYSANPPANPNTGDLWRCSTTGATYTAGVLYRYSGTAWVQDMALALNVPNRNTVLQGAVSASGVPTLFEAGTGLTCKLNATTTPAIFAFMNGNSTSTGAQDIIDGIAADSATFWSSLPINSTVYLYVDRSSGGVLSGNYSTVAPVTQAYAPAHSAGVHWLDFNTGKVQSSDGSAWTQRNRVFVGTATTDGTGVTAVSVYAYNILSVALGGTGGSTPTSALSALGAVPLSGGTMTGPLKYAKGAAIASASTVNLSTATGNIVHITGSVTITAITIGAGQIVDVIFDAAPLLTHSAAIVCPTAASIQTAAGDRCRVVGDATNIANIIGYQRADGTALVGGVLAGQMIQIQSVFKNTSFSGTSKEWADITGLSVSITPASAANKILVTANVAAHGEQQNVLARLMRATTAIAVSTGQTYPATFQFNDSDEGPTSSIAFLDAPASAAAVTYKVQYKCPTGGTFWLNQRGDMGMVSGITVQEVKG